MWEGDLRDYSSNVLCRKCCQCPVSRPLPLYFSVYQLSVQPPAPVFHCFSAFFLFVLAPEAHLSMQQTRSVGWGNNAHEEQPFS